MLRYTKNSPNSECNSKENTNKNQIYILFKINLWNKKGNPGTKSSRYSFRIFFCRPSINSNIAFVERKRRYLEVHVKREQFLFILFVETNCSHGSAKNRIYQKQINKQKCQYESNRVPNNNFFSIEKYCAKPIRIVATYLFFWW